MALWVYLSDAITPKREGKQVVANRNGYQHLWDFELHGDGDVTYTQTDSIFEKLNSRLSQKRLNLADHCIRTWLYVHNVDVNYMDVVNSRKEVFTQEGLTDQTHYIASTGIEGRNNNPQASVIADAYSVGGIQSSQVQFLQARNHMNPTIEYGVTFERATAVNYGDRQHIFISGTASIDHKGEIVHDGDVFKQAERAMENIDALLDEADVEENDLAQIIIYLRDVADYAIIENFYNDRYPQLPRVIVLAPVCRPGWLIEIEGIAIAKKSHSEFSNY